MIITICGLALLLVAFLALALQRFYSSIPAKELKRLAARGDHLAAALYRPVAYGASMRLLLWTIFGLAFSGGLLCVSYGLIAPAAFVVMILAVVGAVLLLSIRLTVHSAKVAVHAAPALSWLLTHLHAPFDLLARGVNRVRVHDAHSGLYEKDDLVALLRQQKEQLDNRIASKDLETLERAAQFNDRQAADVLMPMSRVKLVGMDDHIGPVLLKELHDSGQHSFLVYADSKEQVVGTLFLRDAMQAREGGRVADLVHPKLVYVHEDFTLRQVLSAFMTTSQFMVVVINAFEEAVGVITLEQLLAELIGETADDEFTAYENRAAVAAYKPAKEPEEAPAASDAQPSEPESGAPAQQSSPEATEVVE